ncbi:MAG: TrmB family transcriptional regulator [Candidatus Ranarchaeia archaeon]
MPISERTKRVLRGLGLTDYETKAYLTVLELGEATAANISHVSKIPYSRVYEVLKRLEDKGWVQLQSGKPQRYIPLPPSDAFQSYKLNLLRKIGDSEVEIVQSLQPIYDQRGGAERSDVIILHGEDNILAKMLDMINKANAYAFIALPPIPNNMWSLIGLWAQIIKQRGCKVRLLLTKSPGHGILEPFGFAEKRVQVGLYASGIIIDQRETLLALPEPQSPVDSEKKKKKMHSMEGHLRKPLRWAIWSDHSGLALIATTYFEHIWEKAFPL